MLAIYSIRSLYTQRWAALPAALAMALSVALVTSMTLVIDNLSGALLHGGRADNVMIMTKHAPTVYESNLSPEEVATAKALPGMAADDAHPLVAIERISFVRLHTAEANAPGVAIVRGVDPTSFQFHDTARVLRGEMPPSGHPGLLIGERLLGRFSELREGGKVRIGRSVWPIVGVLSAPGTIYESELWCDREALLGELGGARVVNLLLTRVSQPGAVAEMNRRLSATLNNDMFAVTELDYNRARVKELVPYLGAAWFLTAMLMIAAAFSMVSTMHSLLMRRRRELGTLLAIGFTRGQIIGMLSVESSILVAVGATIGYLATLPLYGRTYNFPDWYILVRLTLSVLPILFSGLVVVSVVLTSLAISVLYVRRLAILDALRAG